MANVQVGIVGLGVMGTQLAAFVHQRLGVAPLVAHGTTGDLLALAPCDVVIECVTENLAVKRKVFAALESVVSPDAVLATNTSALSVISIASDLRFPTRMLAMHFFNPVARMKLVEVAPTAHTSPAALQTALALTFELRKTPVICQDRPGFVVNRLLMLVVGQALAALNNGMPMAEVDQALKDLGLPLPISQLVCLIGLNTIELVLELLPNPAHLQSALTTGTDLYCKLSADLSAEIESMLAEQVVSSREVIRQCLLLGAGWRLPSLQKKFN